MSTSTIDKHLAHVAGLLDSYARLSGALQADLCNVEILISSARRWLARGDIAEALRVLSEMESAVKTGQARESEDFEPVDVIDTPTARDAAVYA